jgi:hypothetical protein
MTQALVIVDIQNDYFPGGAMPLEGSPEAAANAAKSSSVKSSDIGIRSSSARRNSTRSASDNCSTSRRIWVTAVVMP